MKTAPKLMRAVGALLILAVLRLPAAADAPAISVRPRLPDNQNPAVRGYFDLTVAPGQTQELQLDVVNRGDEEMRVTLEAVTATTNQNGIVNYTSPGESDETLLHAFADMVTLGDEALTVPPGATATATLLLQVPDEPFPGEVLGSVRVLKALTEAELNSGQTLINQYSFVVGVRLTQSDQLPPPDFDLGEVYADLSNYRASVITKIRNTQPLLVKGLQASVRIDEKKSGEAVFQRDAAALEMAPNSVLPFVLEDGAGYGVAPGDYTARVRLEYLGEVWEFERDFTIAAADAAGINSGALNQETRQTALRGGMSLTTILLIAGAVLLILVLVVLVLILRRLQSGKDSDGN